MASSRASLDGSDNGPRGRSRVPRGPGFSGEEVKFLFKTVEALLPGSMDEWDALARVYNARFLLATRSGESLRRKFLKLGRTAYAERARRIKVLIQKRLRKEAGFQLPEDMEDEEEEEREEDEYQAQEQPGEGVSGTDSDAHGNRSDAHAEQEREDAEAEVDMAVEESRSPTGRRSSSVSSDEPDDANDDANDLDQDHGSASEARSAVVEPVTSSPSVVVDSVANGANGEAPLAQRDSDTPQLPTVPPLVYRPASASTPEVPTRPATHYALPSDQHPHHPPGRLLSFPLQRLPAPVVAVGQHQREGFRESSEAPSSESTTLSSPAVANRWFALEERRLLLDEQRMAFEQRRLAVEERRLQLLERRMDADAAERNRLLEVLQLVMKSGGGSNSRTAAS